MIILPSQEDLIQAFRPLDRPKLTDLPKGPYPLAVRPYLSWSDATGQRVFLVMNSKRSPLGVLFRASTGTGQTSHFCQWCHAIRPPQGMDLLVAQASAKTSVGVWVCKGVSCLESMRNPQCNGLRESLEPGEKLVRLTSNMERFALKNLF